MSINSAHGLSGYANYWQYYVGKVSQYVHSSMQLQSLYVTYNAMELLYSVLVNYKYNLARNFIKSLQLHLRVLI